MGTATTGRGFLRGRVRVLRVFVAISVNQCESVSRDREPGSTLRLGGSARGIFRSFFTARSGVGAQGMTAAGTGGWSGTLIWTGGRNKIAAEQGSAATS